jgi:uncharacterized membrane protein HdeD (DUF308 family)
VGGTVLIVACSVSDTGELKPERAMTTTTSDHGEHHTPARVGHSVMASTALRAQWGWLLTFGIVQILAGACAIAVPPLAAFAAALIFGWLMIVSAVMQIVHAFAVRKWSGFVLHFIGGLLYAAIGVLLVLYPLPGVLTLAVLLAAFFLADGAIRVFLRYRIRGQEGWGWFLAGGVASMALGVLMMFGWPATAMWTLGLLLGINLLIAGGLNTALALQCRRKKQTEQGSPGGSPTHAHA